MKRKLYLLMLLPYLTYGISVECEEALNKATEVRMRFVNNNASIVEDYSAKDKARRVCEEKT